MSFGQSHILLQFYSAVVYLTLHNIMCILCVAYLVQLDHPRRLKTDLGLFSGAICLKVPTIGGPKKSPRASEWWSWIPKEAPSCSNMMQHEGFTRHFEWNVTNTSTQSGTSQTLGIQPYMQDWLSPKYQNHGFEKQNRKLRWLRYNKYGEIWWFSTFSNPQIKYVKGCEGADENWSGWSMSHLDIGTNI